MTLGYLPSELIEPQSTSRFQGKRDVLLPKPMYAATGE